MLRAIVTIPDFTCCCFYVHFTMGETMMVFHQFEKQILGSFNHTTILYKRVAYLSRDLMAKYYSET